MFVCVLWRTRVASCNGWWRELLHSRRFAEWTEEGKHKREYERERCRFFLVGDLLVVVALRLLNLLLMNSIALMT
jgi:hypothetical protein